MKQMRVLLTLFCFFWLLACGKLSREEAERRIKELKSPDAGERSQAALALADGGEEAKRAVPELMVLLNDRNAGVRSSAAFALRKLGTPEAIKSLSVKRSDS